MAFCNIFREGRVMRNDDVRNFLKLHMVYALVNQQNELVATYVSRELVPDDVRFKLLDLRECIL